MTNGISVAYRGTDISNSSDYSRSIDSRWKFLEVAYEDEYILNLPAIAPGVDSSKGYEQKYDIFAHNLNLYPLIEASVEIISGTPASSQSGDGKSSFWGRTLYTYPFVLLSDQNTLSFFPQYFYSTGQNAVTIKIKYRIYNLDVTQEYQAPTVSMPNSNAGTISTGIKILDGTQSIDVTAKSPEGFSLDTTQKTLAIHMVHTQFMDNTNNTFTHTVGYPPTYLLIQAPSAVFSGYATVYNIPSRNTVFVAPTIEPIVRVTAFSNTMTFKGVQSVFQGTYTFIVLKDPAEIAQ